MHPPVAPLIGVVASYHRVTSSSPGGEDRLFAGAYEAYLRSLIHAGALPVIVPLELAPAALRGLFDRLDGILLAGGSDIDPILYGAPAVHSTTSATEPERDLTEIAITRWATEEGLPFLGICRGHQVANVALGGTLYQDIPSQLSTNIQHDNPGRPLDYHAHHVRLEPASRLAQIAGLTDLPTNSRHHQAVERPGQGLVITARTADGVIEATERPASPFFLSVQWHPENLYPHDPAAQALFKSFVEAAAEFRHERLNILAD